MDQRLININLEISNREKDIIYLKGLAERIKKGEIVGFSNVSFPKS